MNNFSKGTTSSQSFTKKAMHILDQAAVKDNAGEYEIAHKLYGDGIEYMSTAIDSENEPVRVQQMRDKLEECKLRMEHLDSCDWDQVAPLNMFEHGILTRLSTISVSDSGPSSGNSNEDDSNEMLAKIDETERRECARANDNDESEIPKIESDYKLKRGEERSRATSSGTKMKDAVGTKDSCFCCLQ